MRSALYYPHTEIESEQLLKTALLLWDQVYTIAPWPNYVPRYASREAQEAFELFGHCHFPTDDEKQHAHELVKDFVKRPLPAAFTYVPDMHMPRLPDISWYETSKTYEISLKKLLPETWELLQEHGLTEAPRQQEAIYQAAQRDPFSRISDIEPDFNVATPTGLSLMAILADSCAGNSMKRITDKGGAYATLTGLLLATEEELKADGARNELVPIPMKVVAGDDIPMSSLIAFRKREAASSDGHSIRKLRHTLADKIEVQAKDLCAATSLLARNEIMRQFEQDIQDDYRDLREALKAHTVQALGTKEMLMSVVTGIATIAAATLNPIIRVPETLTWSGCAVTIGGLLSAKSKLAEERRKTLNDHPTAYLYETLGGIRW